MGMYVSFRGFLMFCFGLFLLNPEAHDTREVSAIRSLVSNQITFSGIGLEIQRIV